MSISNLFFLINFFIPPREEGSPLSDYLIDEAFSEFLFESNVELSCPLVTKGTLLELGMGCYFCSRSIVGCFTLRILLACKSFKEAPLFFF